MMNTIQEEHKKEIKKLHEDKELEMVKVVNANSKISELESKVEKIRMQSAMAIELRDSKIKNLQRAIANIRMDVKNGKPPRPPMPIETMEEYECYYEESDD